MLQSTGSQKVGHDLATEQQQHFGGLKVVSEAKEHRGLGP